MKSLAAPVVLLTLFSLPAIWASPRASLPTKQDLLVDGKKIPGFNVQAPDMYAGLMPIQNHKQSLYFIYAPLEEGPATGKEDLIIWFNGGPGCSSLYGFFTENVGPITFVPGSTKVINAVKNPYSWTKMAHLLVLDQPVGTGFSPGKVKISTEQDLAKDFHGFLASFFEVFPELQKARISLAGESYASRYVTHIADRILREGQFEMGSLVIADGDLVAYAWSEQVPTYKEALAHQVDLGLNATVLDDLKAKAEQSGITPEFLDSVLEYPQTKPLLLPTQYDPQVMLWEQMCRIAREVNPCWTWYDYTQKCPSPVDAVGFNDGLLSPDNVFNNVPGLKAALHAPNVTWLACSSGSVFKNGADTTPPLAEDPVWSNVVDQVTRKNRVLIWHGLKDFIIFPVASELGVQNTTWQGERGFKAKPADALTVGGNRVGTMATERGLTLAFVDECGHACPRYKPDVAFALMRYALGQTSAVQ